MEFFLFCPRRKILDEEIVESNLLTSLSLISLSMFNYFYLLSLEVLLIHCFDSPLSRFRIVKLDVGKSPAFSIREFFKFSWEDLSEILEFVKKLFLSNILLKILNKHISIFIKFSFVLIIMRHHSDSLTLDFLVVHLLHTSCCFFFIIESQESKSLWLSSSVVYNDLSLLNLKSFCCKELQKV